MNHRDVRRHVPASLLAALSLLASSSWAALNNEVLVQNCAGHLEVTEGDTVRVSCDGELTLSGGRLLADRPLLIEGVSALHLLDVRVSASAITLRSAGAITLNEGVNLDADAVSIAAPDGATNASLTVAPGAVIAKQASLMVRTHDDTVTAVGFTVVAANREGGTIALRPGTSVVAEDTPVAEAASGVSAAASAVEATPAALSPATGAPATTSAHQDGGGGAIDGLGLAVLAALAGVAQARSRRSQR